jgi:REP element-mobilizing transposase RayT
MRQLNLISSAHFKKEHGGSLSVGRRRARRPLSTKEALHVTLRSQFATGERSLLRHRPLIQGVIKKAARRFHIRVYRVAICSNHIHLLIRGKKRVQTQNFFRVFAGHIAQGILDVCPYKPNEGPGLSRIGAKQGCKKNQRKFWEMLLYSRVLTWGREFATVAAYIIQNKLEALLLIAYRPRKKAKIFKEEPKPLKLFKPFTSSGI